MKFLNLVLLFIAMLLTSSCVSVLPSSEDVKMPQSIDISRMKVSVEDGAMTGLAEARFFEERIFNKSEQGPELQFKYLECAANFDDGIAHRYLNAFLPFFTLGFVPHKMKYNCPLEMQIANGSGEVRKFRYDISVNTTASIYELFKKKDPVASQLNEERFRGTRKIIQEKFSQLFIRK